MEVTARGSLQIRGLTEASAAMLAAEVDALGIAVRTGVPVETGPLAGLDPEEIADPGRWPERIRAAIEEAGLTQRLGPKVSVVVDGGGQLTMDAVTADVRLTAMRTDCGVRWSVSIAGDGRSARSLAVADEGAARDIAVAALRMIAEKGREAHARDLSERQLGSLASWRSFPPPSVLPDISPARGEIRRSSFCQLPFAWRLSRWSAQRTESQLLGFPNDDRPERQRRAGSGRTEGGGKDRLPIGPFALNSYCALGIGLPYGSMPATRSLTSCKGRTHLAPPKSA